MIRDFADLIGELHGEEKLITQRLRSIILETGPQLREKISFGVPYFYHNRQVCFVWPASCIPCGMQKSDKLMVTLGFCYGNLLSNEQGLLVADNRKQVYVVPIHSMNEIDERSIIELVQEAILVDDEFGKQKKRKKNG